MPNDHEQLKGAPVPPRDTWLYSDRFLAALQAAAQLHAAQDRKGTGIPYISHLMGTCAIALEYGANEDQAIAALLHDVIEDIEPVEAARATVASFGDEVLRIVEACTDSDVHPKPPWRERKAAYLAHVHEADRAILLVSASDKLYNVRAIVADLHRHGMAYLAKFNPESDQVWYYRSLVTAFRANPAHPSDLVDELDQSVIELERLASDGAAH